MPAPSARGVARCLRLTLLCCAVLAALPALAQSGPDATPPASSSAPAGDAPGSGPPGLSMGGTRSYYVQSALTLQQTFTDNGRLQGSEGRAEAITQIRPSVRVGVRGPRVQGAIDYAVNGIVYARDSDRNEVQQSLNLTSSGGLELIENRLFVDGSASVSQQAVTPFGQLPPDATRPGDNLTQVTTYTLSPYLVGNLGSAARYRVGLSHSASNASNASRFDGSSTSGQASISSGPAFARLGWGVAATRTVADFDEGRRTESDSVVANVSYIVGADLLLRANAGVDANDFRSVDKQRYERYGVGAEWRPTERTLVSAQVDDRYFGTGYNVTLQHRTPRTVWTFSDSRDVSDISGRATAVVGTAYDLFYAQFASIQPDPLLRELLVLEFLRVNGIPRDTLLLSNYLYSSATLQRRQLLSFALVGRRSTLTVASTRSHSSRADTLVNVGDVFDESSVVRQRGLSVNAAHRLTPSSSVNLNLAEQRSTGDLASQSTRLRSAVLTWSTQVGHRTDFSLSARHAEFDSDTAPYTENALVATLTLRF